MSIIIESYEPYPNYFPGLLAVSRATIDFVKELRSLGIDVRINSEKDGKVFWIKESKALETIANLVMYLLPIGISLYAPEIRAALNKIKNRYPGKEPEVIVRSTDGNLTSYPTETSISQEARDLLLNQRIKPWVRPFVLGGIPTIAIYLEHTSRIVGCVESVYEDKVGLMLDGVHLIDPEIENKVRSGELTGSSIGGIVKSSECVICHQEYSMCNHLSNRTYGGKMCTVRIKKFAIAEISLVSDPSQPRARIKWIPNFSPAKSRKRQ